MPGWRYDKPNEYRPVLTCSRAGLAIGYWCNGLWWDEYGNPMRGASCQPWAWQELPEECKPPEEASGAREE